MADEETPVAAVDTTGASKRVNDLQQALALHHTDLETFETCPVCGVYINV